jgi:hypothetical protein
MLSRRLLLLSLVLTFLFGTLASANPITVNMNSLGPGAHNSGSYATYPYYFSINGGQATAMMCDSFTNHISTGDTRSAQVSGLLARKDSFGKDTMDHKAAGIIFLGVMNGTISATTGGSPGHGQQEFIGYRSPLATPEPGTLLLLSTGLMGMAGLLRRKLND